MKAGCSLRCRFRTGTGRDTRPDTQRPAARTAGRWRAARRVLPQGPWRLSATRARVFRPRGDPLGPRSSPRTWFSNQERRGAGALRGAAPAGPRGLSRESGQGAGGGAVPRQEHPASPALRGPQLAGAGFGAQPCPPALAAALEKHRGGASGFVSFRQGLPVSTWGRLSSDPLPKGRTFRGL